MRVRIAHELSPKRSRACTIVAHKPQQQRHSTIQIFRATIKRPKYNFIMLVSTIIILGLLAVQAVTADTNMLRSFTNRHLAQQGSTKVKNKRATGEAYFSSGDGSCADYAEDHETYEEYDTYMEVKVSMYEQAGTGRVKDGKGKLDKRIEISVGRFDFCENTSWHGYGSTNFSGFDGNFCESGTKVNINTKVCDDAECKNVVLKAKITPTSAWSQTNPTLSSAEAKFELTKLLIDGVSIPLDDYDSNGWLDTW